MTEYSVDRCYFMEGIKDTNGGADTFFNFSSSNSSDYCKEECLKLENCAAVAYFQEYCFFYEMKDISPKSEEGSILFNRVCPIGNFGLIFCHTTDFRLGFNFIHYLDQYKTCCLVTS